MVVEVLGLNLDLDLDLDLLDLALQSHWAWRIDHRNNHFAREVKALQGRPSVALVRMSCVVQARHRYCSQRHSCRSPSGVIVVRHRPGRDLAYDHVLVR